MLIEADLRRPRLADTFGLPRLRPGLTSVLVGHSQLGRATTEIKLPPTPGRPRASERGRHRAAERPAAAEPVRARRQPAHAPARRRPRRPLRHRHHRLAADAARSPTRSALAKLVDGVIIVVRAKSATRDDADGCGRSSSGSTSPSSASSSPTSPSRPLLRGVHERARARRGRGPGRRRSPRAVQRQRKGRRLAEGRDLTTAASADEAGRRRRAARGAPRALRPAGRRAVGQAAELARRAWSLAAALLVVIAIAHRDRCRRPRRDDLRRGGLARRPHRRPPRRRARRSSCSPTTCSRTGVADAAPVAAARRAGPLRVLDPAQRLLGRTARSRLHDLLQLPARRSPTCSRSRLLVRTPKDATAVL